MPTSRLGSRKRRDAAPLTLRQLREQLGVSQGELARALGSSQPAILKTETSPDLRLSTVGRFVDGLGRVAGGRAEVRLIALIGNEEHALSMPAETESETEPQTDTSAWRLRAWDDPVLEAAWLDEAVISMSADEIGDLTTWPGDEQVGLLLSQSAARSFRPGDRDLRHVLAVLRSRDGGRRHGGNPNVRQAGRYREDHRRIPIRRTEPRTRAFATFGPWSG